MVNRPSKFQCPKPRCLASHARSLLTELGLSFAGPIHEIAAAISQTKQLLSALPRSHPLRPVCAYHLAKALGDRYRLSNQIDDLNKSILYLTDSLLSPLNSWLAHGPMIVKVLLYLALSLLMRSNASREPEDAIYAAKYLRQLRDPARAPIAFMRQSVTALLVETLAFQMVSKDGNVIQTLEEMAVLLQELLTSDAPDDYITGTTTRFTAALSSLSRFPLSIPDRPLNHIIKCLQLARMRKPELRLVHLLLARCLSFRYFNTCVNDDYEEAASILDEMITHSSPGDGVVSLCQEMLTTLVMIRAMLCDTPENSEEAIYHARASFAVKDAPPSFSRLLEHVAKNRFKYFGPIGGLETSSSDSLSSLPVPVDDSMPTQKMDSLDGLLDGICNNHLTDIDEAIEKGRAILASSDQSDLEASRLRGVFGDILFEAFEHTHKIEYINESISTLRRGLVRPSPTPQKLIMLCQLLRSLYTRSVFVLQLSHHIPVEDLHEAVELFPQCLDDGNGLLNLLRRFTLACFWASIARDIRHPSISTAYETAMSLMQDTLLFAPTLHLQHTTLASRVDYHEMPLDYASHLVDLGQLEKAVETLERGRALLWSEMRHLRASINKLHQADPELGHKFAVVNRDLEELTKSIPPSHKLNTDDGGADNLRAADPFGRLLLKQRGLLKERGELISQIQALPGFDRFLTSPSFDTLHSAASSGPVIIINQSKPRPDILILHHNTSPSLIPTPNDFYDRGIALKEKLFKSRDKDGLDSNQYDQTLSSVLAELYELVGKPVINRLRQLKVPKQSRIWWCPTSVFCSLPLHAMGPIPSDDGEPRYFLDLYICSFTPTLSALIQSRNRDSGSRSLGRPSILLVAQPDPSLPTVGGEIQVVQALDIEVTSLVSAAATSAAVINEFQHHQFVHFACHGTLAVGKPFEAGFELYRGERLTLLEIVRSDVPTAEFAFSLLVTRPRRRTEASWTKDCTWWLQCNTAGSGAWSGLCGLWWTRMDGTWRSIFTRRCSQIRDEIKGYLIMKDQRRRSVSL